MAINEFQKHEQTLQELQNRSYDPTFDVNAVEILGYDATGNALRRISVDGDGQLATNPDKYAVRVAVDSVHNDWFYIGKAVPSASNSNPVWQIKKMVKTTTVITITWCDGDLEFNNVWDDRESLSFS